MPQLTNIKVFKNNSQDIIGIGSTGHTLEPINSDAFFFIELHGVDWQGDDPLNFLRGASMESTRFRIEATSETGDLTLNNRLLFSIKGHSSSNFLDMKFQLDDQIAENNATTQSDQNVVTHSEQATVSRSEEASINQSEDTPTEETVSRSEEASIRQPEDIPTEEAVVESAESSTSSSGNNSAGRGGCAMVGGVFVLAFMMCYFLFI